MRPIALLSALSLVGCASTSKDVVPTQSDSEFFRGTTSQQLEKFAKYDIETQYHLLVVGNQIVHPPAIYLVHEFAKRGSSVIPLLSHELAKAKEEATIRDIVAVLAEMRYLNAYDATADAGLIALVDARIASMRGQWKPIAQRLRRELGDSSGVLR